MPDDVPNMRMGAGYNSVSQTPLDIIMEVRDTYKVLGDTGAPNSVMYSDMIESRKQLSDILGIQGSMEMGLGGFGATATIDRLNTLQYNQYSLMFFVHVLVSTQQEVLQEYKMVEQAKPYLSQQDIFFRFAGDEFVSSRRLGGEFIALLKLETSNSTEYNQLKENFGATYKSIFSGSGSVSASTFSSITETINKQKGTFYVFKRGGKPQLPSWDVESIRDSALSFVGEVANTDSPLRYPFRVTTMPYKNLMAYADAKAYDLASAHDTIRRNARFYGEAAEKLDSIRYILRNLEEFIEPDIDSLVKYDSLITKSMNTIRSTIQNCIVSPLDPDRCKLLTVSELYNPAEIMLPRRVSGRFKRGQGPVCGIQGYEQTAVPRTCRCVENGTDIIQTQFFDKKVRVANRKREVVEQSISQLNSNPESAISTDPATYGLGVGWRFLRVELVENKLEADKQASEQVCKTKTSRIMDGETVEVCTYVPYTYHEQIALVRAHFALEAYREAPNPACGVDMVNDLGRPIYNFCEHPSFGME